MLRLIHYTKGGTTTFSQQTMNITLAFLRSLFASLLLIYVCASNYVVRQVL